MFLLDSDVVIDVLRGYKPAMNWLQTVNGQKIAVTGYSAMELIGGCRNKSEVDRTKRVLRDLDVMWADSDTCDAALELFSTASLSHGTGMLDCLIGLTALSHDMPLHTFNQKHFDAIPSLRTIQPYSKI